MRGTRFDVAEGADLLAVSAEAPLTLPWGVIGTIRGMTIQAVVFDIGGVLEITPSLAVTERWESRPGMEAGEINKRMKDVWYGGGIGTISEADVHRALAERLGFDQRQVDEFMGWIWREYLGTANAELTEYARRPRPRYRTGILRNSFVGAREREQGGIRLRRSRRRDRGLFRADERALPPLGPWPPALTVPWRRASRR